MKLKIFILLFFIGTIAYAVYSAVKSHEFKPAEDFPREALVYLQINDLPQFIRLWNESSLKEKYLSGSNFNNLQNRHLGRKLAARWQEFSDAAGFPIDLETLAGLSENRAALAIYDIGKIEFVFIAPVSDEVFAATKFVQNQDRFIEETLDDGTTVYRVTVEADRGRQKQELLFTHCAGRFILTTSQKLLSQTILNIGGSRLKNRLSDDTSFQTLSEKTVTHLATVWTNQTALNDDYYFKHYWLMSDVSNLKNIRASIFDLEIQSGKLIERRKFLLTDAADATPVDQNQAAKILTYLPENIPFYQLQAARPQIVREAITQAIFDRSQNESEPVQNHYYHSGYDFSDDSSDERYGHSSESYDEMIDEQDDEKTVERQAVKVDFAGILDSAAPQSVLTFTRPQVLPAPLFVEFNRAAIFHLATPGNFNRELFESEIARKFAGQTMISSAPAEFKWETKTANNIPRRELQLPMLDWKIVYAVRAGELILTNDEEFFDEISASGSSAAEQPKKSAEKTFSPFGELSVINLAERKNAYDQVFDRLAEENISSGDFLGGDVSGLLDAISDVRKIEIRKNHSRNILEEELIFSSNAE